MWELVQHTQELLSPCAKGLQKGGLGTTCYESGQGGQCSTPKEGQCFTTGGWCPTVDSNAVGGENTFGVTAFCGIQPLVSTIPEGPLVSSS
mmetsp:Transcript_52733/g.127714  ORF Transcript_52733/g.127714 Transcript_52733/m.127714 type:complete len:91 (+) Transcript_52733:76-348(+)